MFHRSRVPHLTPHTCVIIYFLLCLLCTCDFIGFLCHISMKCKPVLSKKIKCDFLHGRKNFAMALKRDKHFAFFQSSPKINRMLITSLICIQ